MFAILSGGWLKGYRTYALIGLTVIGLIINYAVGDIGLIAALTGITGALGGAALRAAVSPPAA